MRRTIVLCVALALVSILSVSQASAFGWRHRVCRCRPAVAVASHVEVTEVAPSDVPGKVDESVALSATLDAMTGMLQREYTLIQWGLNYYEECDDSSTYGSD